MNSYGRIASRGKEPWTGYVIVLVKYLAKEELVVIPNQQVSKVVKLPSNWEKSLVIESRQFATFESSILREVKR